jgi:SAM-dependent methyltransferase
MTTYDEVEYPSRSFNQTHPERAAAIGTLLGMSPPPPSTCRVLDVGCGSGWNLIPMAAAMPDAQFVGFDLAASAIEAAKRDAATLHLNNVRFEHLDLMEFPKELGQFDYIIAHGFYSWVPEPVRLKLLEICRAHLSEQGLAFISFNANPYGRLRRMWRDMMLFHDAQIAVDSPQQRLEQSKAFLETLRDQWTRNATLRFHAKLLDNQIASIQSGGGNWFFHDDLGPFFELFSITDFSREIGSHGLQFAAEALFENLAPEALADTGDDWIVREQNWDNIAFRGFHSTLICHQGIPLQRPAAAFEKLRYAAPLQRTSPTVFRNDWTTSEAESEDPATLAVLGRLEKAWPDSIAFQDLQASPETLKELTLSNVIEPCVTERHLPHFHPVAVTAKPTAWASARLQARRGKVVTNRLHAAIQLEQEPLRRLVIGLDGTRPLLDFQHLFVSQQALLEQLAWLHRAALIQ